MLVIRRTEEQLAKAYQAGLIHGVCHTYVDEEAVATGVCEPLNLIMGSAAGMPGAIAVLGCREKRAAVATPAAGADFGVVNLRWE